MGWFGKSTGAEDRVPDDVAQRAFTCLCMNEFKEYREAYEKEEREIVGRLILAAGSFTAQDGDLTKFGAECLIKLNRLRDLRMLLRDVTVNSKKGAK